MVNVIYGKAGKTLRTARNLARAVKAAGVDVRTTLPPEGTRGNYKMVRWGNSDGVRFIPRQGMLNSKTGVTNASNKYASLETIAAAGVRVPTFSRDKETIRTAVGFPIVGRKNNHQGGTDLKLLNNRRQLGADQSSDYYLQFLDVDREYRVHVFKGEAIAGQLKVENEEFDGNRSDIIRNLANGWRFSLRDIARVRDDIRNTAVTAVNALGLDFGAVDIVVTTDDDVYVLEVNSAPGLDEEGTIFDLYVEKFLHFFTPSMEVEESEPAVSEEPTLVADDTVSPSSEESSVSEALEALQPTQATRDTQIIRLLTDILTELRNR